jgi:hypothetical protein
MDAIPTYSVWRWLRNTRMRDAMRGRLNASLGWRQSIERADLPSELAAAVRNVVGRTRLWRGEKVDLASELIAHFEDGLAAGRSATDLLKSFGDQQAAALLIRRAKKRGRPTMWRVWHISWISALILLVVYASFGLLMSWSRPSIKANYLEVLNKKAVAVPEGQRAWPLYREVLLEIGRDNLLSESQATNLPSYDAEVTQAQLAETAKLVNAHPDAISKLRAAAKRSKLGFVASASKVDFSPEDRKLFGFTITPEEAKAAQAENPQNRWLISTLLPHMQLLRSSALLLARDARIKAAAKDGQAALDDIVSIFGISRHCEETPLLVCSLCAEAVQRDAREAIRDIVGQHPNLWSGAQIRDLVHDMVAARINWMQGFEGERICFYDGMQRVYTDNGRGDGRLSLHVTDDKNLFQMIDSVSMQSDSSSWLFANNAIAMLSLPAANMAVASRKEMTDVYDRITDQAIARLNSPYWQWQNEPGIDDAVKSLGDGPISRFRYLFVCLLTPSYDTLLHRVVTSNGECDGMFIGLALELFHREHGKWPASLDQLSPKFLPSVPVDPINGKPLHFKLVNDRPIVYSVGIDGDDDGGRMPKDSLGDARPENATPRRAPPSQKTIEPAESDGDWVLWALTPQK